MIKNNIQIFCKTPELIENYEQAVNDKTQTWQCHHRLETHNSDGERRLTDITVAELIALDMYFDRPPEELIFMTIKDHLKLHSIENTNMLGKHHSDETRAKMSEAWKTRRLKPVSEETKRKMSEAHKGENNSMYGKHLSEETKHKISEAMKRRAFLKNKH